MRSYNRREAGTTVENQLLSLATKGGAGTGGGADGSGDLRLNVDGVRAALGLDAKVSYVVLRGRSVGQSVGQSVRQPASQPVKPSASPSSISQPFSLRVTTPLHRTYSL